MSSTSLHQLFLFGHLPCVSMFCGFFLLSDLLIVQWSEIQLFRYRGFLQFNCVHLHQPLLLENTDGQHGKPLGRIHTKLVHDDINFGFFFLSISFLAPRMPLNNNPEEKNLTSTIFERLVKSQILDLGKFSNHFKQKWQGTHEEAATTMIMVTPLKNILLP